MRLGVILGASNRILEPGDPERIGYTRHPDSPTLYPKYYPGDLFAFLNPYDIDLSICGELDAVIYYSGAPDSKFLEVIDRMPCKVIAVLCLGYSALVQTTMGQIKLAKSIIDAADFVLGYDEYYEGVVSLLTDTPIITLRIPVPIEYALECAADNAGAPEYDIIIPYGPFQCEITDRNGYIAALAGQRIIDTVDGFRNMAIFNMTRDSNIMIQSRDTLEALGCRDFDLLPLTPYGDYIKMLSKAKFLISLDMNRGAGKVAVDCAILRKPCVLSNTLPYAREIYYDIPFVLVDPLDVGGVLRSPSFDLLWTGEHFGKAFARAQQFSISRAAAKLEEVVLGA